MKRSTALALSVITAFTVSCSFMKPARHSTTIRPGLKPPLSTDDVGGLVEVGIEAYNNGDIATAKTSMEAVLQATRDKPMKSTRARAHFYLAALAWDVGDVKKTNDHIRQCRLLQPLFEPDWTFIAPGLRKHYENLPVKVEPPRNTTQNQTTQQPAAPKPVPEAGPKQAPEQAPKQAPKATPKPAVEQSGPTSADQIPAAQKPDPKPASREPAPEAPAGDASKSKTDNQKLSNPGPAG